MSKIKIWIKSFRLRTLPLSLSGVIFASLIAYSNNKFNIYTCALAISTTLFLQILSNLANDLGDSLKGTDNVNRKGPQRAMQTGIISIKEMKAMILVFVLLSALSGLFLIIHSFEGLSSKNSIYMLSLGGMSIIAAIKYTLGKKSYGYHAMGDIFVFIFFGLASVVGTYFLHSNEIALIMFLPAITIGLLAVGVLNMNNIRDIENDKACGKNTIPVIIGEKKAKIYHYLLVGISFISLVSYFILTRDNFSTLLAAICYTPIIYHLRMVYKLTGREIDSQLKVLSLYTLFIAVASGLISIIFS
jgi:1,4-dihydroxy-2-naphthoate octaprenyltransferase